MGTKPCALMPERDSLNDLILKTLILLVRSREYENKLYRDYDIGILFLYFLPRTSKSLSPKIRTVALTAGHHGRGARENLQQGRGFQGLGFMIPGIFQVFCPLLRLLHGLPLETCMSGFGVWGRISG